jgi:hypothetical protein
LQHFTAFFKNNRQSNQLPANEIFIGRREVVQRQKCPHIENPSALKNADILEFIEQQKSAIVLSAPLDIENVFNLHHGR